MTLSSVGSVTELVVDSEALLSALGQDTLWRRIEVVASTGSTNADVAAWARDGGVDGSVLIAGEQTRGRGRRTRTWASPAGRCVAMSLLVKPRQTISRWGWLSLVAGVAVSRAVQSLGPSASVELKWPNDVLINDRKVCGILSEHVPTPEGNWAVIGIGLNVSLSADDLPVPTATSLLLEGIPADAQRLCLGVLQEFEPVYREWDRRGTVHETYEAACASIGRELSITQADDRVVTGRGHGIDAEGCLQVATPRGIETFAVGDVVHARLNQPTVGD